jgi:hypothetical protein
VRERGVQSRRVRESKEAVRRPAPASSTNMWQVIAIVALLAATAGWTTVAVMALRPSDTASAVASPTDSADPGASDEPTAVPVADTHDAPDLELALPTAVNGVDLQVQSVTGEGLLSDDAWSTVVTTFLTSIGKTAKDLQFAQAADPTQSMDGSFEVYRVPGVDGAKLRDTLITAWKGDFPDLKLTDVTVAGQKMIKGEFDTDTPPSYLYARGEYLYDIWTNDPTIAAAGISALPAPGASSAPRASGSPAASSAATAKPAASASPAP